MAKKPQPVPRKEAEAMAAAVASGKRPTSPPPPKRKSRVKKSAVVTPPVPPSPTTTLGNLDDLVSTGLWKLIPCVLAMLIGIGCGIWIAGGIDVGPSPGPDRSDSLSQAHEADRITQIAVLRELATQPFDGATDDGRRKAAEWFNSQRFRNRADDFGAYTDAVSEAIAGNTEAELAKKLEGK